MVADNNLTVFLLRFTKVGDCILVVPTERHREIFNL
jgi:hypothetical protein